MTRFTPLDAVVLVAYLAGTTALGLYVGRKQTRRQGLLRRERGDSVVGGDVLDRRQRDERAYLHQYPGPGLRREIRRR